MREYRDRAKSGHAAKIKSYSTGKDGTAFRDDKPWDGVPILDSDDKFDEPQKVPTRKAGGRVEGKVAKKRLDRAPRKKGGAVKRADGGDVRKDGSTGNGWGGDLSETAAANGGSSGSAGHLGYVNGRVNTNGSTGRGEAGKNYIESKYKKGGRVKRENGGAMADPSQTVAVRPVEDKKPKLVEYKRGGAVHPDEAEDRKLIRKMVKKEDLRSARAEGGAVKKKGSTTVVINLGAQGAGAMPPPAQRIPVPVPVPAGPGMAQPGAGGPPPGGAPMGVPGAPPPNPMARKRGGRVGKDTGGMVTMKYGARSGEGRLEKEASAKKAGL
jgi:hypothetical protein